MEKKKYMMVIETLTKSKQNKTKERRKGKREKRGNGIITIINKCGGGGRREIMNRRSRS